MRLEFQLLVIDDHPNSISNAVSLLKDHLSSGGFTLRCHTPDDLSPKALRALARGNGKEYDLVAIDYHLGRDDTNGAATAAQLRREMQFTDMVFYSSDPQVNLYEELGKAGVAGVFIAQRQQLDEALIGLADTVIGKAVDLNHMRGIAMAEVAEMDVLMEEALEKAFASTDPEFAAKGKETLEKLLAGAEKHLVQLRELVEAGAVLEVVTDSLLFSSMQRYKAINRVAKCLVEKPADAIDVLKTYDADIIQRRNTLAHAKEEFAEDGAVTLRAVKRGKPSVIINDEWMVSFRGMLHRHRAALVTVCDAMNRHIEARAHKAQEAQA